MKKFILSAIGLTVFVFFAGVAVAAAQEMVGDVMMSSEGHTAREEAEGRTVWERLQSKEITCGDLSDDDFGVLGEYFMGQMMGGSHEAMNNMMIQTHGAAAEEQIHVLIGRRLSGCDASTPFPAGGGGLPAGQAGWMPMTNMMWGGRMTGLGLGSAGGFGWILMILWWVLIIAGVVALVKWLTGRSSRTRGEGKSALDILKERYARGEIDAKEFAEKKSVLG